MMNQQRTTSLIAVMCSAFALIGASFVYADQLQQTEASVTSKKVVNTVEQAVETELINFNDPRIFQARVKSAEIQLMLAKDNVIYAAAERSHANRMFALQQLSAAEHANAEADYFDALALQNQAELAVATAELELSFAISSLTYQGAVDSVQSNSVAVSALQSRTALFQLKKN